MASAASSRPRILSGVQPSGRLHLGNYFGAIRPHIELQDQGECFYFIADYHALTSTRDPRALREFVHDVALTYLAAGLDPQRTVFYRQSDVPEVCELTWLLATVTGMGLLERAHSYKEKVARGITPSVGLFTYPVLMAADILAPQADVVPVGQDQDQHVEMTRDMAHLWNTAFPSEPPTFRVPKAQISPAARVPGTTFEKGAVLQVVTELLPRRSDDSQPIDVDGYVERFRGLVKEILAADRDDAIKTTEDLAQHIDARHAVAFPGIAVRDRVLRLTAEMPAGNAMVTARGDVLGVEFYVPLERIVFLTKDGRRLAAKMSKSYGNTIGMFEEGKALKKKVMGIETRLVELQDPLDPDEDLVMQLYRLLATPDEVAEMTERYRQGGFGFGNAKKALLAKIDEHFAPLRERRKQLEQQPDLVEDVLRDGAVKARAIAQETLDRARDACGLTRTRR